MKSHRFSDIRFEKMRRSYDVFKLLDHDVWPRDKITAILDQGVDFDVMNSIGQSMIDMAVAKNDIAMVTALLDMGHPADTYDFQGRTPLMHAVEEDQTEIATLLLSKGANPDLANDKGETPLMLAAACSDHQMVTALLAKGAHVDIKDKKGNTAVNYANVFGDAAAKKMIKAAALAEKASAKKNAAPKF